MPIIVHGSAPAHGGSDLSPFVVKLETWLRLAGLPYVKKTGGNPASGPKGKVPWVEVDGIRVGDSALIQAHLIRRSGVRLDEGMTPQETAQAHLLRRAFEEGLYFHMVRSRWCEETAWPVQRAALRALFPPLLGAIVPAIVRRQVRRKAWEQGVARHSTEEAEAMAVADLDAARAILGDQDYVMGPAPRSVDATVYAFVAGFQGFAVDSPTRTAALHPTWRAYVGRIRDQYWAEERLVST